MKKIACFILLLFASACKKEVGVAIYYTDNNIVAHKGAWADGHCPPNSVAALKKAIEMNCAGSEFDVWLTKDDSLIINHDPTYAGKNVENNTYSVLAKTRLANGEMLPTLRKFLYAGSGQNQTKLFLEIKSLTYKEETANKIADRIADAVNEMQMQDHVIYTSFHFSALKEIHRRFPDAQTQFLGGIYSPDIIKSAGISGINYDIDSFYHHTDWLPSAKKDSLVLAAWTVNDKFQFIWLLENKFNYVVTDEPGSFFRVLEQTRK